MKKLSLFLINIFYISICLGAPIIGGAVDEQKNKNGIFQLAIFSEGDTGACTATKISDSHILTSAHCFIDQEIKSLAISTKTNNRDMEYDPLEFEEIYLHESYSSLSREEREQMHANFISKDIAIVKVKPDSNNYFSELDIIEVDYSKVTAGKRVEFWGYGCQNNIYDLEAYMPVRKVGYSYTLAKEELTKNHKLMTEYYTYFADEIFQNNIPTAGKRMDSSASSVCFGDSGGPLILEGKLVGVNAYYTFDDLDPNSESGYGEGVSFTNLHVRVSELRDWIEHILKQ
ncbi:MAG: trypsin-like serine protease [Bacteriovoracaceae bacterium]|jgi:secreted trypsin-like serine protease|nr:trypsin-like serine protease [Bacteriovoracaceae bacterium]